MEKRNKMQTATKILMSDEGARSNIRNKKNPAAKITPLLKTEIIETMTVSNNIIM